MAKRSLVVSQYHLNKVERALTEKTWNFSDLATAGDCSRQPAVKFCTGKAVDRKLFVKFCNVLGLNWEQISGWGSGNERIRDEVKVTSDKTSDLVQRLRQDMRADIQEHCGKMRVLDMTRPIGLGDIYTDVNILETVTSCQRLELDDLLKNFDPESDDFERRGLGRVVEKRVAGLKVVKRYPKLMVLGKPGAGKTTFLKHLALQCIQGKFFNSRIPVLITLKDFAETKGQPELIDYINNKLAKYEISEAQTIELFKNGRFLILLDGLDEVKNKDSRRVFRQIEKVSRDLFFSSEFKTKQSEILNKRESVLEALINIDSGDSDSISPALSDFIDSHIDIVTYKYLQNICRHNGPKRASTLNTIRQLINELYLLNLEPIDYSSNLLKTGLVEITHNNLESYKARAHSKLGSTLKSKKRLSIKDIIDNFKRRKTRLLEFVNKIDRGEVSSIDPELDTILRGELNKKTAKSLSDIFVYNGEKRRDIFRKILTKIDEIYPNLVELEDQGLNFVSNLYLDENHNNSYVITCRIAAQQFSFREFSDVEVADFNERQIQSFVSKWFKHNPVRSSDFIQKLDEHKDVKELACSPLLLTLLCLIFSGSNDFPTNRAELYEEGISVLLKRWDGERSIERDQVYKALSAARKEDLLSYIAWTTFKSNDYFFKQKKAIKYIFEYIQNLSNSSDNRRELELDSEVILKSIEAQHGLLVERAKGIYSFSHLTFHEYFAARSLTTISDPEELEEAFKLLASHTFEKRWREVIMLAIGILPSADRLVFLMKESIDRKVTSHSSSQKFSEFLSWIRSKARQSSNSSQVMLKTLFVCLYRDRPVMQRWYFDDKEIDFLKNYHYANALLTACLNSECFVARTVRVHIKTTLLYPQTIDNNKQSLADPDP